MTASAAPRPGGEETGSVSLGGPARPGSDAVARGTPERLNRYLARRGVASRRAADLLIAAGRVTVGERIARVGETLVAGEVPVWVDGRPVPPAPPFRTLALHKPTGVVSTRRDPQGRTTVLDLVADADELVCVGRLDADTWGLLLLSNDGDLVFRLTHPRFGIEKVYRAAVVGRATPAALERLRRGVDLDDGPARGRRLSVVGRWEGGDVLEVVMVEGRRRQVRRMLAAVGLAVADLGRLAVGPIRLGRLAPGRVRLLRGDELARLYRAVGRELRE